MDLSRGSNLSPFTSHLNAKMEGNSKSLKSPKASHEHCSIPPSHQSAYDFGVDRRVVGAERVVVELSLAFAIYAHKRIKCI